MFEHMELFKKAELQFAEAHKRLDSILFDAVNLWGEDPETPDEEKLNTCLACFTRLAEALRIPDEADVAQRLLWDRLEMVPMTPVTRLIEIIEGAQNEFETYRQTCSLVVQECEETLKAIE